MEDRPRPPSRLAAMEEDEEEGRSRKKYLGRTHAMATISSKNTTKTKVSKARKPGSTCIGNAASRTWSPSKLWRVKMLSRPMYHELLKVFSTLYRTLSIHSCHCRRDER